MLLTLSPDNGLKSNNAITSLPIVNDGPGKYRTRAGLEVNIDNIVIVNIMAQEGLLCFVGRGTSWKKHWQKDNWTIAGLYSVNQNHQHDVVSKELG